MKDVISGKHKILQILFWSNLIFFIVLFLILLFVKGSMLEVNVNVVFEQYAILFTLAGIPLALKLFHSQYKKIQENDDRTYWRKLKIIYIIRLAILDAVIILNIIGFYLLCSKNSVYMVIITIFALMFCYPAKSLLIRNNIEENNSTKE